MQIKVPLYRRLGPGQQYASNGVVVPQDGFISSVGSEKGQALDGVDDWYKDTNGFYYWGGGLEGVATQSQLARMAVEQNYERLKAVNPDILSLSDAVNDLNDQITHVVAIYLKADNLQGIPSFLDVNFNGCKFKVATEIIENVGDPIAHFSQRYNDVSEENSSGYVGSLCCMVSSKNDPSFRGIVTAGHIYTNGANMVFDDWLAKENQTEALISGNVSGTWLILSMDGTHDIAVAKLTVPFTPDVQYTSFISGCQTTDDNNVKKSVTVISRGNKVRTAYIVDYNTTFPITYTGPGGIVTNNVSKIILIGSSPVRTNSTRVSDEGDSGSCVFDPVTNKLIGILIGGGKKFSYVLDIQDTLNKYNLNLL